MGEHYVSGNGNRGNNTKLEWFLVKDFVDEETDIIIRVKGTTNTFQPQYSAQIGRIIRGKPQEDGSLGEPLMEELRDGQMAYMMSPHLGIRTTGQGRLSLSELTERQPVAIAKLLAEVNLYMLHSHIQPRMDEIIAEREEKERRQADQQFAGTSVEREHKKGGNKRKKGVPRSKVVGTETTED